MRSFMDKLNEKTRQFMAGRYGGDSFSRFLLGAVLVLLVLALITRIGLFSLLGFAALIFSYYRMLSRNYEARRRENEWFLDKKNRLFRSARVQKRRFNERREYRYFKCPGCGQNVRVPKGKGHIMITCPKCRTQFDKTV